MDTFCACCTALYVHLQVEEDEKEDLSVINAVGNAIRRHPNLVEVTVGRDCSVSLTSGVVKGVLQKANVQKLDVMESQLTFDHHLVATGGISCECECILRV